MIQRERIAENVYSFQSDIYAQVTSGAVIGPKWAVVIDTLALPEETISIRDFIEQEISVPIKYLINTHSHADHAWGNCYFPNSTIISHSLCRELLNTKGRQSLSEIRQSNRTFRNVKISLPSMTFDNGELNLLVGKKSLKLFPLPGHSADNVGVLIGEDRVLFAGDVAMPIPYIVDGDYEEIIESLEKISKMGLENVVQGHGDIVLRGEIESYVEDNLNYLKKIRRVVVKSSRRKYPRDLLDANSIEDCGKSHVLLGGLAEELHNRNLIALFYQMYGETPQSSDYDQYYN